MAADLQAIDAGQHQVEDQRVPTALLQQAQAFAAVGAVHHLEVFVAQVQADQVGNVGVVLDHQDSFGLIHVRETFACGSRIMRVLQQCSYHELFNSA